MPAPPLAVAAREPRRARYLIPRDLPRRGEIIAALWALTLIGHLLLAQLTILLAVAFQVVSRVSRWRPHWPASLMAPAGYWAIWPRPRAIPRTSSTWARCSEGWGTGCHGSCRSPCQLPRVREPPRGGCA